MLETVEETSRYESELKDLRKSNERLELELSELKGQAHTSHEAPLLAAPGAMISTLARRVASQLGADSPSVPPQPPPPPSSDNLEESMRKVNKYVGTHSIIFTGFLTIVFPIGLASNALLVASS